MDSKAAHRIPARPRTAERAMLWPWHIAGLLLVIFIANFLRFGTEIRYLDEMRGEDRMRAPIANILNEGWSRETMLDYEGIKGPVFFWIYAAGGELLGSDIADLRLISVILFVLTVIPLLLIVQRCGASGPMLLGISALYALVPYNAFIAQLLFSEPSFIFLSMWLMWLFMWGFGTSPANEKRLWGPVLFAVLLAILLHHRPHAVAFAGAVALISFERDGFRSWPWWLACLIAGLSRLPLWSYWDGLVTSAYQDVYGLGLRVEGLTYLLAAVVPVTAVFLWPALRDPVLRFRWPWVAGGAVIGLFFAVVFTPDVAGTVEAVHPETGEVIERAEFAGVIRTGLRILSLPGPLETLALISLVTLGGSSLGAMLVVTAERNITDPEGVVWRLGFMTLGIGLLLYMFTLSPVYDRYLQIWIVLLPVLWLWSLPKWLFALKVAFLLAMLVYLANSWLY